MSEAQRLEQAITEAGRDKVFAIMLDAGWKSYETPPMFAWWEAVRSAKEAIRNLGEK